MTTTRLATLAAEADRLRQLIDGSLLDGLTVPERRGLAVAQCRLILKQLQRMTPDLDGSILDPRD